MDLGCAIVKAYVYSAKGIGFTSYRCLEFIIEPMKLKTDDISARRSTPVFTIHTVMSEFKAEERKTKVTYRRRIIK